VLGMRAAHPVEDKDDLGALLVKVGDRLVDHGPHDALFQPPVGRRRRPDRLEVLGQGGEGEGCSVEAPRCGGLVDATLSGVGSGYV
jgi:hypothetical protein